MELNKFPEMRYSGRILGEHMTLMEAAGFLELSVEQLKKLTEEREIPTIRLQDTNIYYEKEKLVKLALAGGDECIDDNHQRLIELKANKMNNLKVRVMPQIKFHAVNIYVSDLDRALFYYKRLGFEVEDVDAAYTAMIVRLPHGNCPDICLKDAHAYERKPGEITIGITADDDQGVTHEDVFLDLLYRGFVYSNMEPGSMYGDTTCNLGVLTDPDGMQLELGDMYSPIDR